MKRIVLATAFVALGSPALAHTGAGEVSGLAAGLSHPIGGLDHLLAMAAVGLWSGAVAGPRRVWVAPVAFVLAMLAGAGLAFTGLALPMVEGMIALSVLLLGLLAALRLRLPLGAGAALVAVFALFHGHAHGTEAAGGLGTYILGFALSTAAIQAGGAALGLWFARSPAVNAIFGAAIAAAGLTMVAG